MAIQRTTLKNFYRGLAATAYIAGATAAATALGGPAAGAAAAASATAAVASPGGIAAVEIVAELATDSAIDSKAMATGGLITEPTFVMLGEMGPEMVIPLTGLPVVKRKRSRSARASDKLLSAAFKEANRRYRKKDGSLRAGRTQSDIAKLAHRLKKKSGTKKGQVRKTARRAFEGRRR